jgi:hypothetical protein
MFLLNHVPDLMGVLHGNDFGRFPQVLKQLMEWAIHFAAMMCGSTSVNL